MRSAPWPLIALVPFVLGCATARVPMAPDETLRDRVIDGRTGQALSPREVDARLVAARVIFVGEEHANPLFQRVQAEVLERVALLAPETAMAIEWLPASKTLALAGYVMSTPPATLESLRVAVDWDRVWGHDFAAYAPLFELARQRHLPIVPLNAEPGLARFVARGGRDGVPPERQAELPPLDSGNDAHREWFRARMEAAAHGHPGHALSGDAFDRFYLAQLVWDETMARNVVVAARTHKLVVFAGTGHVEYGLGIPARIGPLPQLVIRPIASPELPPPPAGRTPGNGEADLYWVAASSRSM